MQKTETSQLPPWLLQPETISEEACSAMEQELIGTVGEHVNYLLGIGQQVIEAPFVEWRCEGKYVYDPKGREFFDCMGAGGVFGLGFRHPRVIEAVKAQLDRMALSTRAGLVPAQAALAEKLIKVAPPGLKGVFFGSSGTEAVEAAIKLARLATGRPGLVGTHFGYHGLSLGTISLSGLRLWRQGVEPALGGTTLIQHGNLAELRSVVDETTAAVILEPIQWAAGCRVADDEYFKEVKAHCRRMGALLILDEIQTGLGRTGHWFACEHWGVEPDILCVGKVLSGGVVPVSATLYSEQVQQAERMRLLFNNSSFGGNPLACTAGYAAMECLEDGLLENSKRLGDQLGEGFDSLREEFPDLVAGQHGLGLMRCLEMTQPIYGSMLADYLRRESRIMTASLAHIPQFIRVSPPFICEPEDIDHLMAETRRIVRKFQEMGMEALTQELQAMSGRFQEIAAKNG